MNTKLLSEEVQQFIKDHQHDDPFLLSLHSKMLPDFPLREAIEQIQSAQKAINKLPSWVSAKNIIWPKPLSVEQASSEITATFKASLFQGNSIADLTGGMGVDTFHFSAQFGKVHYVEPNRELAEITEHNFSVLGRNNISIHQSNAELFLDQHRELLDLIYFDPSRRQESKKVFRLEDCTPNPIEIVPRCLEICGRVLMKLSPMVDLSILIRQFEPSAIWVVAVKNEVKEVLCLVEQGKKALRIHAVDINEPGKHSIFSFATEEETDATATFVMPQDYLYEPSAAILKSGAFKLVSRRYHLDKLHIHSHLYTSKRLVVDFPGRVFRLVAMVEADKKRLKSSLPDGKANVITRNYPLSSEQLKKKLGLSDGGDQYLIGTMLMDGKKGLLYCERIV